MKEKKGNFSLYTSLTHYRMQMDQRQSRTISIVIHGQHWISTVHLRSGPIHAIDYTGIEYNRRTMSTTTIDLRSTMTKDSDKPDRLEELRCLNGQIVDHFHLIPTS